jgi:PfaB family protein
MAVIYTLILQDVFHLKPRYAFGYSLGESSMLYAMQVWREGDAGASVLASTPLFRSRLSGSKEAVRDYWLQKGVPYPWDEVPWANYVLMADPVSLQDRIRSFYPYVFLTHINAPRQVVIAGEPDHCQELIKQANAPSLRAPFDHVLHCEAMAADYDEISRISTWEAHPNTEVKLYSAGNYAPLLFEKDAIAASIATALTSTLDFPRLIQRVYDDGARIFIEVGAGSNCSKWIDETLKQQDHASFAVNRRGTDDTTSLVRLLARLISHRVPLSLSSLLSNTRID